MANLDLAAILTGATADQAIVDAHLAELNALMADTHLSDAAHAQIKVVLDQYAVWKHVIEGFIGRVNAWQALGYPVLPAGALLQSLKDEILMALQAEEDIINAEQDAINKLFTVGVDGGTLDFASAIEKK